MFGDANVGKHRIPTSGSHNQDESVDAVSDSITQG